MRVYIAGPIAGKPNGNREAFAQRAKELESVGLESVNPHDIPIDHDGSVPCLGGPLDPSVVSGGHQYGCALRADIRVLLTCQGISLLDGWKGSKGARTEWHVAQSIGLLVVGSI